MIKKFVGSALLGVGLLGLGAMQAQAQLGDMQSQTFNFSGTCTGGNNVISSPPITFSSTSNGGTLTGADIVLFQVPTGLQYAYVSIAGNSGTTITWLGPGQTHVTTFPGAAGSFPVTTSVGNGFSVSNNSGINLTLACSSGNWQAWVTIFYHAP